MVRALALAAARNNAAWCDAVCRTHGAPGTFDGALWLHAGAVPPFYPNAVTLEPGRTDAQREALARLAGPACVKDSFAELDLAACGYAELFRAQWLRVPDALPRPAASGVVWRRVQDASALSAWAAAWASGAPPPDVFRPALLAGPDVAVLGAWRGEALVAGAVAFRAAGVVGLTNVFVVPGAPSSLLAEALAEAGVAFPGLPRVGYEHGEALAAWCALGCEPLGALRVWWRG